LQHGGSFGTKSTSPYQVNMVEHRRTCPIFLFIQLLRSQISDVANATAIRWMCILKVCSSGSVSGLSRRSFRWMPGALDPELDQSVHLDSVLPPRALLIRSCWPPLLTGSPHSPAQPRPADPVRRHAGAAGHGAGVGAGGGAGRADPAGQGLCARAAHPSQ
jgi:hypothetical protein